MSKGLAHASDWITALLTNLYFVLSVRYSTPFARQFFLGDLSIAHPFAVHERVPTIACLVFITILPAIVILVTRFLREQPRTFRITSGVANEILIAFLGLVMSFVISGAVMETLKNWIGRPRPDFLARCGPSAGTPVDKLVDVSVCTAPFGSIMLKDGFRSAPSGHAAMSFACLLFLSLWLSGQLRLFEKKDSTSTTALYRYALCLWPIGLATYISFSRTQDYRHHFTDVFSGGALGIAIAVMCYHRYFPRLDSEAPHMPYGAESGPILP